MDKRTISEFGIEAFTLMEIAGSKAAEFICTKLSKQSKGIFFCGKGNNAGDALVVARMLSEKNHSVVVYFVDGEESLSENTHRNLSLLKKLDGDISILTSETTIELNNFDFIIDGMLGTGLHSNVKEPYSSVIDKINTSDKPVFALDIPTGLNSNTGGIMGIAVRAAYTLTFGVAKTGFYLNDGFDISGEVILCELPFPNYLREKSAYLIDESWVNDLEVHEVERKHKYDGGVIYILAGSEGLTGAAILSAQAAWSTGVGAVILITPKGLLTVYEKNLIQVVKKPVGKPSDTYFTQQHLEEVLKVLSEKPGILLIGPGLGRNKKTQAFITELLSVNILDTIIDADALFALSTLKRIPKPANVDWILTPHIGELKTLFDNEISDDFDRLIQTASFSKKENLTIVSKGFPVIVTTSEGDAFITKYNSRIFSRTGYGDILAGKISGYWLLNKNAELSSIFALLEGKQKADTHNLTAASPLEPIHLI